MKRQLFSSFFFNNHWNSSRWFFPLSLSLTPFVSFRFFSGFWFGTKLVAGALYDINHYKDYKIRRITIIEKERMKERRNYFGRSWILWICVSNRKTFLWNVIANNDVFYVTWSMNRLLDWVIIMMWTERIIHPKIEIGWRNIFLDQDPCENLLYNRRKTCVLHHKVIWNKCFVVLVSGSSVHFWWSNPVPQVIKK